MSHGRWWGRLQRHASCGKSSRGISDSWATYSVHTIHVGRQLMSSYTNLQHPSTSAVRCQQVQGSDSAVPCIINAGVGTLCMVSIEPLSSLFRQGDASWATPPNRVRILQEIILIQWKTTVIQILPQSQNIILVGVLQLC